MFKKSIFLIAVFLIFTSSLHAAILTVNQDGSGQFLTINGALSAAQDGDQIHVGQGTYYETLVVDKSVTIEAVGDRTVTAIDGNNANSIMKIEGNVNVSLRGITFSNAYSSDHSALVIWNQATAVIEDCAFVDNYATGSNAVHVRHDGTRASFYRCDFLRNDCGVHSAALSMGFGGYLLVEDCFFAYNTSHGVAGAVNCNAGEVDFHGNLFLRNSGSGPGALVIQSSAFGKVANNTFHKNSGAGGVRINEDTTFQNNIVTCNNGGPGLVSYSSDMHFCNLYFDNEGGPVFGSELGENEIVTDPLYCDYPSYDFTLCVLSPALGINSGCGTMGAFGEGCTDCGVVSTQQQTLDGLKSLYR